jgi:hypothetical protein
MRATFRLLAAIFACAAAYHLLVAAAPTLLGSGVDGSRARHTTFAVINALVAVLMIRRPTGFAIAFALLCGQQLASHGSELVRGLEQGRIDWTSMGVVLVMPLAMVLLLVDARRGARGRGTTAARSPTGA